MLKKPPKPTICIYDCDTLLFESSAAGETTFYVYKDEEGREICRFDSAKKAKNWIEECSHMEADIRFQYQGDVTALTRHVEYEIKDFEECRKVFDQGLKKILKLSGCKEIRAYISSKSGAKVFRNDLATLRQYKPSRKDSRKPHHLENVRRYARTLPEVKVTRGFVETDDRVMQDAEKLKHRACLAFSDKDGLQGKGVWLLHVGKHEKPVWSSSKILGRIGERKDGSIKKIGYLALMYQMIVGDSIDGVGGIKGKGEKLVRDILFEYDGEPISELPSLVETVLRAYYEVYGSEYTYQHWYDSREITASYKDVFKENLLLLWMRRFKDDECRVIMDIVDNLDLE